MTCELESLRGIFSALRRGLISPHVKSMRLMRGCLARCWLLGLIKCCVVSMLVLFRVRGQVSDWDPMWLDTASLQYWGSPWTRLQQDLMERRSKEQSEAIANW